ncbi:MAG: hypothetical protein N3B21_14395 [Clostridia bacterium]|nr:hypothetical protein [Clostridia bacterium]
MFFRAEIIKGASFDPLFKIVFSYETDSVKIERGYAEVLRKAPRPLITYDSNTAEKLKLMDKAKLELELLNIVISYLMSKGISRSKKGNIVVNTA